MTNKVTIDPMAFALSITRLIEDVRKFGLDIRINVDFNAYARVRTEVRGKPTTPFFAPGLSNFTTDNALWISGIAEGKVVHLQAFRQDNVGRDFDAWFMTWMMGLQTRYGEPVRTLRPAPLTSDVVSSINGSAVYHGEFWVDPAFRKKGGGRTFAANLSQLGLLLAALKWRPSAVWSIISEKVSDVGFMTRAGYYRTQRDYLVWEVAPDQASTNREHIALSTLSDLSNLVAEISAAP